jgi:hypothetical protein
MRFFQLYFRDSANGCGAETDQLNSCGAELRPMFVEYERSSMPRAGSVTHKKKEKMRMPHDEDIRRVEVDS